MKKTTKLSMLLAVMVFALFLPTMLVKAENVADVTKEDSNTYGATCQHVWEEKVTYTVTDDMSRCKGRYEQKCSLCHYVVHVIEEITDLNFIKHIPSTCTEKGYDYYLTEPFEWDVFSYQVWYKEFYPALGHEWDKGVITTPATTTSTGIKTYTCKHDKTHTRTEVIPKLSSSNKEEMKTGITYDSKRGWIYVENSVINSNYNDLYYDNTYGWWKITNGMVDFGYNDLFFSPGLNSWWKVAGGTIDFGYNDLFFSPGLQSWWKITNGYIDFGYNDLFFSPGLNSWWKVAGGTIDFGYNDLFFSPGLNSWWKVVGGTIDFGYYGAYYSPGLNSWWNIWGGMLVF